MTKEIVAALIAEAARNGGKLDGVNCGLCVDERGAGEAIEGVQRGSPADFWKMAEASDNTLVIGWPKTSPDRLDAGGLVRGPERVTRDGLPGLFAAHDHVWHW